MPGKLPHELSREALLAIVAGVQERMYLERNPEGREFWNPDKEWSGADLGMGGRRRDHPDHAPHAAHPQGTLFLGHSDGHRASTDPHRDVTGHHSSPAK